MAWKSQLPCNGAGALEQAFQKTIARVVLIPVSGLRNPVRQKRGVICFQGLPFELGRSMPGHPAEHNVQMCKADARTLCLG